MINTEKVFSIVWILGVVVCFGLLGWYILESIFLTRKTRKNLKFEHNDITHYHKHEYSFMPGSQNLIMPNETEKEKING